MNRHTDDPERDTSVADWDNDGQSDDSHASTGGAAGAGAVTGGVIGAVGGPVGIAAGAAAGAAIGAVVERVMHGMAGHDHFEGDEDHWAGDHDHTGDDDGHDHRFHYDLGYNAQHSPWESASPRFRERWQERFGAGGHRWEDAERGYRYGFEMAHDPRYSGREWPDVEEDLRGYYDEWGRARGYSQDPADWAERREQAYQAWAMTRTGSHLW